MSPKPTKAPLALCLTLFPCALWSAPAPLPAQEIPAQETKTQDVALNENETLIEMQWGFDPKRGFMVRPNPVLGEMRPDLTPYFREDEFSRTMTHFLSNAGVTGYLTFLFFGNEDALSHCFANYHFRRMGLDLTDQGLRMRIAQPAEGKNAHETQLAQMHRLMAVRIVQRRGLKSAVAELATLSRDQGVDLLLRWAAQDAMATLTGKPVAAADLASRGPSLAETLAAVPDEFDAILSIDQASIPFFRELPWLGRRLGMEITMEHIKAAGGSITPTQLAGAQLLADGNSLIFFEIVRELGNFRISRVTATVYAERGKQEPHQWLRVDGYFDAKRLRGLFALNGGTIDGETVSMEEGTIRVTDRFIEVRSPDYPMEKVGGNAEALRQLGIGDNQVFLQMKSLQRLSVMLGAPLAQVDGALFLARLSGDRQLTVEARCKNPAQARGFLNLVELAKGQIREELKRGSGKHSMKIDMQSFEDMFFPQITHEDDSSLITGRWNGAKLSYAKLLKTMLGIENAVSTQDGQAAAKAPK